MGQVHAIMKRQRSEVRAIVDSLVEDLSAIIRSHADKAVESVLAKRGLTRRPKRLGRARVAPLALVPVEPPSPRSARKPSGGAPKPRARRAPTSSRPRAEQLSLF